MKKIITAGGILALTPMLAFAADAISIIVSAQHILNIVIPALITIAVVYFIWGVIQYTLSSDEEKKKNARTIIIQGIIGLFVILAFWGIVDVIGNTFGVKGRQLNGSEVPCVPIPNSSGQRIC